MFDHSRFVRMITLALASCAVTWAFAGSALARPDALAAGAAPAAPAFKDVAGDTDKAPSTPTPAFKGVAADVDKTPNPAQVDRVLASLDSKGTTQARVDTNDDTGTIALFVSIAAILTAVAAMTLGITRSRRPMLGA